METPSWTCPLCGKAFAKENQSHQCVRTSVEEVFEGKAHLLPLYEHLLSRLDLPGEFTVTTSRKAVTLYAENKKAFLVIEPKKAFLDVWFLLDRKIEDFPVYKTLQPSKTRFANFMRLYEPSDADRLVLGLIRKGYDFITGN